MHYSLLSDHPMLHNPSHRQRRLKKPKTNKSTATFNEHNRCTQLNRICRTQCGGHADDSTALRTQNSDDSTALRTQNSDDSTALRTQNSDDSTALRTQNSDDSTALRTQNSDDSTALRTQNSDDSTALRFQNAMQCVKM
jgi:hypothetical protein